jgi:transposase
MTTTTSDILHPQSNLIISNLITPLQIDILNEIVQGYLTSKAISVRAQIILHSISNSNYSIMETLGISWKTVKKWINRWFQFSPNFIEITEKHKMKKAILQCLKDAPRVGRPMTFTLEEVTKIVHLACTKPESINIPLSHWSSRALAQYLKDQNIISKISHESVSFHLRKSDLKPHKTRYWLNSRTRNSLDYDDRIKSICVLYKNSIEMHKNGVHIISIDEKSGIQAIERAEPNRPMRPRSPEKIEHEYLRHGTQCLIGNLEVGTGKMLTPMVSETRKNGDFVLNIQNLIDLDPNGEWIFILDQLNIHKSEALVRFIAFKNNFEGDLGESGHRGKGILRSMKSRMEFLEDASHRIRFQFTPKHCSWMNQIEIWFSGFSKRFVKRNSCSSVGALKKGILNYIDYYNCKFAKPFKWTYEGKILQA